MNCGHDQKFDDDCNFISKRDQDPRHIFADIAQGKYGIIIRQRAAQLRKSG